MAKVELMVTSVDDKLIAEFPFLLLNMCNYDI